MKQAGHCILCDNKITDFKYGVICGLTNKKSDFQIKCDTIKLDKNFEEKITNANIEYEAVLETKTDAYGLFFFYNIITVLIIITGYLIGEYALKYGVISPIPIIIMSIGIITLGKGFGSFNNYNNTLKLANDAKHKIDTIAKLYSYKYKIDIQNFKDSLGNCTYKTDLRLKKKLK